ncbi:Protein FAR1-RELATED SEQUENCE 5 [Linum perenne]
MPANRNVGEADKDTLRHYSETSLRPSEAYDLEVHHSRGHANVGYNKRDAFNQCNRDDIEKLSEGDAATTLAYLKSKTNGDMDFFMEHTVDEDMLEKVFWADSSSIADFKAFSDVLIFDTTYKKNKYNLPFVIFSSVNHHYSTCIFGCAFLQHEKEYNYTWALDTLTKSMGGKKRSAIITDGDHAMSIAITKVFPKATHRLCSWHLDKNVAQHVKDTQFKLGWSKFVDAE